MGVPSLALWRVVQFMTQIFRKENACDSMDV
jgi:hypothetical protein